MERRCLQAFANTTSSSVAALQGKQSHSAGHTGVTQPDTLTLVQAAHQHQHYGVVADEI